MGICCEKNTKVSTNIYTQRRWRKQIGTIDDHNECEWVNVSSGTGSPGQSQTKGHKMVVAVPGQPVWILLKQMLRWQWHQLHHM